MATSPSHHQPAAAAAAVSPPTSIYGPTNFKDEFRMAKKKDEFAAVLAKIERIYDQVQLRDDELLDGGGGFCFGLLAPATNILVNTVISKSAATRAARGGGGHGGGRDMGQRSLDGLIAFLTCLFPYLPDAEAVAYLDATDADPLAAALLVIDRRGLRRFGFCSVATVAAVEAALGCAAAAAAHPDPRRLVQGWKLLSHGLNLDDKSVAGMTPAGGSAVLLHVVQAMQETPAPDLQLKEPWELAGARLELDGNNPTGNKELPPVRAAAKRKLLATIHGFYLQALARLPAAELRSRHHRGMLEGGSCYGPLDPVSNIIVNAVWYDQNFPASKQVTLDMVSTESLWRAAARSFYGLVSFLCTRYHGLSPDQALQRLLVTGASLKDADPNLFDNYCDEGTKRSSAEAGIIVIPSTSAGEAYAAAAAAAFHRSPLAQKELLGSPDAVSKLKAASEALRLQDGLMVSSEDLELLSMVLLKCASAVGQSHLQLQQQVPAPAPAPEKVKKWGYANVCSSRTRFWGQHERARSMVAAALDKFNDTVVPKYKLHVICGVNEFVSGPEFSLDWEVERYDPWTPYIYHNSHINFLATCEGSECAGAPATLFFAECSNHGTGTCWCVPVSMPHPDAEQVRCVYCENRGIRVVHPDERNFHGRDEFERLFYGPDRKTYSNDDAITKNIVDWVHGVQDDAIYADYCIDADYVGDQELHIS